MSETTTNNIKTIEDKYKDKPKNKEEWFKQYEKFSKDRISQAYNCVGVLNTIAHSDHAPEIIKQIAASAIEKYDMADIALDIFEQENKFSDVVDLQQNQEYTGEMLSNVRKSVSSVLDKYKDKG